MQGVRGERLRPSSACSAQSTRSRPPLAERPCSHGIASAFSTSRLFSSAADSDLPSLSCRNEGGKEGDETR